jgi:hypothetical protein
MQINKTERIQKELHEGKEEIAPTTQVKRTRL